MDQHAKKSSPGGDRKISDDIISLLRDARFLILFSFLFFFFFSFFFPFSSLPSFLHATRFSEDQLPP
ncbi:hypothetical protein ACN38_g3798 [Penicillium nordicum]|uniref:Transmembrane protein n=1 Tax=Penicillium nordicum TaxID=229535 RepID=A0A0M9WHS8_9EURO|nr:hypothetical protein ACN38_g3798 [Penicillium nordicum]